MRDELTTIIFSWIMLMTVACTPTNSEQKPDNVRIFAAASTGPALKKISQIMGAAGSRISLNLAASSTLARQIEHGAPCDFVLLADQVWMDYLEAKNKIAAGSRANLLANTLVLIAPKNQSFSWQYGGKIGLLEAISGKLALADPSHVPAGKYAKQSLEALGVYSRLRGRILPAPDVRAALLWVERGDASAGIVYATDEKSSDNVSLVAHLPQSTHAPIKYPFARCKDRNTSIDLNAFRRSFSQSSKQVFKEFGFIFLNK